MGNSSSGQFLKEKKKKRWDAFGQLHRLEKDKSSLKKIVNVGAEWKPSPRNWPLKL